MALNVSQAQAPSNVKVRVLFDKQVKQVNPANTDDALNPVNYRITGSGITVVESVSIVDAYTVELQLDDIRDNLEYRTPYTVVVSGVESVVGDTLFSNLATFYVMPWVAAIRPVDSRTIDVEFTEDLHINADMLNISSYESSAIIRELSVVGPRIIRFNTDEQSPGSLYTFRVSLGGSLVDSSFLSIQVWNETPTINTPTLYVFSQGYLASSTRMYMNGIRLELGQDYIESDPSLGQITFVSAPSGVLIVDYIKAGGSLGNSIYNEVPSGAVDGVNLVYTTAYNIDNLIHAVFANGVRLELGVDYTKTSPNQITLTSALPPASTIIMDYEKV